ncbi:MAG TPA: SRPBCC domain-containing protein, partial [Caulobacteraceae bacterium]|nr:SRPBCC domain-containing protein [Caulobacteraceae bacterium]
MLEPEFEPAHFVREGDAVEARLGALIDEHVERVWAALTEPDLLVQWLAPGRIELRMGGPVNLDFGDSGVVIDSTVTALEPQRVLEYGWNGPDD